MPHAPLDTAAYCAREVRAHDYERYLGAVFAPPPARRRLMALYAFNLEVAKTRETVSEAPIGEMRLQFWRDAVEAVFGGRPPRHAVAEALAEAHGETPFSRALLDRLIDARAFDLSDEPPEDMAALEAYCEATSATLMTLALEALGAATEAAREAARAGGIAYALAGLLAAVPHHAAARRLYLPKSLLAGQGADARALFRGRGTPALSAAARDVAEAAGAHLAAARARLGVAPRQGLPALLPLVAADLRLRRLAAAGHDPFAAAARPGRLGLQLRVSAAALRRRL